MKTNYRKIWEDVYGEIPLDDEGRTYEIHHIDGNRDNNSIDNLMCVPIQEHYKIHYENGDYGACVMIAKRMNLPVDYISNIQKGKKRPGIGGVKKGTVPWNKGVSGYSLNISEQGKLNQLNSLKARSIISDEDSILIRNDYNNKIYINDSKIGIKQKNGRVYSYERAFCKHYSKIYDVSEQYIYRIIKGLVKIV